MKDTGTGIAASELPHIFERFYQVRGARGRNYEGSGIGLSLVQELVRLHGGTIRVSSVVDGGTTFTVSLPTGSAHLPPDRIDATRTLVSTATGAAPYVEEVLSWLPEGGFGLRSTDTESIRNSDEPTKDLKSKIQNPKSSSWMTTLICAITCGGYWQIGDTQWKL